MAESLYSPSWYRVAKLKPRVRAHAQVHRHHYRGQLWYVLQDHASGRVHRFTPAVYLLVGLMNGTRTLQEIWDVGLSRLVDEAPTQEEVIRLLSQLHSADLIQCDVAPDTEELLRRFEGKQHSRLRQNLRSPLSVRIPLFDPDRLLALLSPIARMLFGWLGAVIWLAVVGMAVFVVGVHWAELTENVTDRILAPQNLFLLWLSFPFVKALHEFGHAFSVKVWGGEVHEMGIMFLVFTPVPYVDASSASAFREKRKRVLVGAAGMLVESFVAALSLFVWINVQPGAVRTVAYNVLLIAGVSTLVFNANPLLRYDGYYVLADLLEIPNLATRGSRYLGYLIQRYVLGAKNLEVPVATRGERVWFVVYSTAAFLFRLLVYTTIFLFVASRFVAIGIVILAWGALSLLVLPVGRAVSFLFSSSTGRSRRTRATVVTALAAAGVAALTFVVPFPSWTRAEGVVWVPEQSVVRAGTDGFVRRVLANPGDRVGAGDPLLECYDPLLPSQVRVLESRLRELEAAHDGQVLRDRVQAEITEAEIEAVTAELSRARERLGELTVRSLTDGTFVVPMADDLPGRFVRQGEMVGYVVHEAVTTVRVVVSQEDVDLVRYRTRRVDVRLAEDIAEVIPAMFLREVPSATDKLPSTALGREGGGEIAIDPRQAGSARAFQKVFEFDMELLFPDLKPKLGGRVYVRFDHGTEPLGQQGYRSLRRLLLSRFNV